MFRTKSKEELAADLKAYDWLRENPDKYSPLGEKNQPFWHDIFPESNEHCRHEEEEGRFFSRFPDEWVPNEIQVVHAPTFSTYRLPSEAKAYYIKPGKSGSMFDEMTALARLVPDSDAVLVKQTHVVMSKIMRFRTWDFRVPVTSDHKRFKDLVKDTLSMVVQLGVVDQRLIGALVNMYLMSLFESRQVNRLGYLKNEVAVGVRFATYAVEVKDGKAEKR